ncbi:hypothetical protein ABW20_dc0107026 [Dactylellina cionopaga]|nr:hypothetical protein ABW20_dc0107026 [Dactylellina cionopaga]
MAEPDLSTSHGGTGELSTSRYIPPHIRHQPKSSPANAAAPTSVSPTASSEQTLFTASEIYQHFGVVHGGTINPSINNHKELAYILIFLNQHPQYPPDIFIKSNLELVFKDAFQGDETNALLRDLEIPLFEEEKKAGKRVFRFKSWVKIQKAERLEKGSEALVDMLTLKWRSDTPRRSGFEMREREKSRKECDAKITATVEKGTNGEEIVVENAGFKNDPDADYEQRPVSPVAQGAGSSSLTQKVEQTVPRSEWAWKNSLGVDWAVVTLEFVQTGKGNPLHGPPVQLTAPVKTKEPVEQERIEKEIGDLLKPTESLSLGRTEDYQKDAGKTIRGNSGRRSEKVELLKILRPQTDGADDTVTVMINDDLDSASIPSSPVLEPATPKKGSALNLSAYALSNPSDGSHLLPEKASAAGGELSISQSDISQSYISTGMGESVVDDFGAISATSETDAEESDRWSELSDHERPEDEHWMAVERGGMAKEVF